MQSNALFFSISPFISALLLSLLFAESVSNDIYLKKRILTGNAYSIQYSLHICTNLLIRVLKDSTTEDAKLFFNLGKARKEVFYRNLETAE